MSGRGFVKSIIALYKEIVMPVQQFSVSDCLQIVFSHINLNGVQLLQPSMKVHLSECEFC